MTKQNTNELLSSLGLTKTEVAKKKRSVSQDVPDAIANGLKYDFGRREPAFHLAINADTEDAPTIMRVHLGSTENPLESFQNASTFLKMLAATCLEAAQVADDALLKMQNPEVLVEEPQETLEA